MTSSFETFSEVGVSPRPIYPRLLTSCPFIASDANARTTSRCETGLSTTAGMRLGTDHFAFEQKSYGFYRPAAIQIANTLADIPFSATRVLIYDIIVYFMPHLSYSAGGFFTFHLLNYMCFLTMQGFFRTVGLMCPNFDTALRLSVFFFPNMVIYVGYMIPVDQMKRWLFWIVS